MSTKKTMTERQVTELTNEIEDEIDRLHEVKDTKLRVSIAKELIEYINLHYIEYAE